MGQDSARIVLTAKKPVQVAVAETKKGEDGTSFRFVLDAEITTKAKFAELVKEQQWRAPAPVSTSAITPDDKTSRQTDFVIAVDAGHGGIDAGASGGVTGTEEKVITLTFAKELVERMNREPGIKAFLTRDSDTFLALSERVTIARQNNANLFISLHADTLKQKGIRGRPSIHCQTAPQTAGRRSWPSAKTSPTRLPVWQPPASRLRWPISFSISPGAKRRPFR